MANMKPVKQQVRGATRMKQQGRKLVQVWLDAREVSLILGASRRAKKKLATWVREKAVHAAEESGREERRQAKREQGH